MKQYKFTIEEKFKYIKIAESKGLKNAILDFAEEFREIYKNKSKSKKADKEWMLHIYANNLIRNWQKKFYNNDMKSLISTRGKIKSPRKPKKNIQLTPFWKWSEVYQEIMENFLEDTIDPAIVLEELKKENKNKKKIKVKSKIALEFVVFLTLIHFDLWENKGEKTTEENDLWWKVTWVNSWKFHFESKGKRAWLLYNIYINQGNY
ncbi:hypothetical protein [Mesomycoplasma ovipneumoniae]|uniref:hypothetical protein n=1 Tax=Mesomycoplasma ovipneumoniae TaxID=29562 RepID=UPI00311B350E